MNRLQRKLWTHVAEAAALGLTLLSVVFYFALVRPLRNMRLAAENDVVAAEARGQVVSARVSRLQQYRVDVPKSESELKEFLAQHVAERRQGFSHAAKMLRKMSEDSKVRLTGVAYKLSGAGEQPLANLALEFDIEGSFGDVLRFTHELETSGDFLRVKAFTFSPGESRAIAMHVGAELYLKP
jgi:hypothetical protein